jgi:uncharacterized protein YndB with AHSA1/START domain
MLERLVDGVRIVRTIPGAPADVFAAWVDRERLRAWWGPPGIVVTALDGELRIGGSYRIVMEQPDRERRTLVWTFREIDPPARLVYTWRWADGPEAGPESLVTVRFRPAGERTEVEIVHTGIPDPAVRDSHGSGWQGCLDALVAALEGAQPAAR